MLIYDTSSVLTQKFPNVPTFQTLGKEQDFTCATNLIGENTNAKVTTSGMFLFFILEEIVFKFEIN
jgi:hypothetical protein